jgi:hypothetical protein
VEERYGGKVIIENQVVKVKWNGSNINKFIGLGYIFTKTGDELEINVAHLSKKSPVLVWIECDYCKKLIQKPYKNIRDPKKCCCNDDCRKKLDRNRIKINCKVCEKEVERTPSQIAKSKDHFCSNKCADKFRSDRLTISKKCEICDSEFRIRKSLSHQRFCSIQCQHTWQSIELVGEKANGFKKEIPLTDRLIKCDWCNVDFTIRSPYKLNEERHFCSKECSREWFTKDWSQSEEWKEESRLRAVEILSSGIISKTETECQKTINQMLDELNIKYENEYNCKYVSIDNYLLDFNLMIEVMGTYWHCDPRHYKTIEYQTQVDRIKHDKIKNSYIKNNYNIDILYIWESDVVSSYDLCKNLIRNYTNQKGKLNNYHSFNYNFDDKGNLGVNEDLLLPYFSYEKNDLNLIIDIKDKDQIVSKKQLDKWISFNCDYCGKEKEQLISHYNKSATHCCSKNCMYELRRDVKYNEK